MHLISIALVAAASAIFAVGADAATASQIAPAPTQGSILKGIADPRFAATLAWAGEDETFAQVDLQMLNASDAESNLMVPRAAPEPPAIVLAGMAIGGVFCGRSLLRRKRAATSEEG
jgi:hypothetical protein